MKRVTQAEASYRRGDPVNHCGVCKFYQGHHRCNQVMGDISPFGISDVFKADQNPFGATLAPREIAAIKAMAADASDRSGDAVGGAPAPMQPQQQTPPRPMPFNG